MKSITIICPLYNAEKYILPFDASIKMQKKVDIKEIRYILTESSDNTEKILKENKIKYELVKKKDFSHSTVREKAAFAAKGEVLVFVTQDVVIEDDEWLYKLTKDIDDKNIVATYARQVTKYNNIEKYTRECNYPEKSFVKTKEDIPKLGLQTFFFSDAASAISAKVFKKLNGYDQKRLMFSEDMYIAHKIINAGYKIKYCAEAVVFHSHKLTLKQLYKRYKDTGAFFKQESYFNDYKANAAGAKLAKHVFKRLLQEHRFLLLLRFPFDMGARYLGKKAGER